jgi:hypothetical protein
LLLGTAVAIDTAHADGPSDTPQCDFSNFPPMLITPTDLPAVSTAGEVTPGTVLTGLAPGTTVRDTGWGGLHVVSTWWLKDGTRAVSNAKDYTVTEHDVGSTFQLFADVGLVPDCGITPFPRLAYAPPVKVVAAQTPEPPGAAPTSTVKTTLAAKSITSAKKAKLAVTVTTSANDAPIGLLTVKWGTKASQKVKVGLRAKANGKATVTLPKLKAGRYTLSTTFTDLTGLGPNATATTTLKVSNPPK